MEYFLPCTYLGIATNVVSVEMSYFSSSSSNLIPLFIGTQKPGYQTNQRFDATIFARHPVFPLGLESQRYNLELYPPLQRSAETDHIPSYQGFFSVLS